MREDFNRKAAEINSQYNKEELAVARYYYNTAQLVEFWRYYNDELKRICKTKIVNRAFPLFEVHVDPEKLDYKINPDFFSQA